MCNTNFSLQKHYSAHPNGDLRKWIPKLVSKFYNDPTVNEYGNVVLLG